MTKIKVLILGDFPFSENYSSIGGVEASLLAFLSGISDDEKDKIFYFLSFSKSHNIKRILHPKLNVVIVQFPLKKYFSFIRLIIGRVISKQVIKIIQPDIIHFIGSGPTILFLNRMTRKKSILTQHGIIEEELKYLNSFSVKLFTYIKIIINKIYLSDFKYRVFISHYISKLGDKSKIKLWAVIPNPVNKMFFEMSNHNQNTLDEINKIIVVGNISPLKNQILGLKLANMLLLNNLYNFNLIFAGHTKNSNYYQKLLAYLGHNQNLDNYVEFIGNIRHELLINYLAESKFLLVLSLHENTPMVIAEAQSMGKVVIAPNLGGINEMIEHEKNGFLYNTNNLEQLYSIFFKLLTNFDSNLISVAARKWAYEKYHPDIIVKMTSNFYNKCLE